MLTYTGCRARQARLLATMERERWDLFVTTNYRTVYWITGVLAPAEIPIYFALTSHGHTSLISSVKPGEGAPVNDYFALPTYSLERNITDLAHDAARLLRFFPPGTRYGVEGNFSCTHGTRCQALAAVQRLRRHKDEDEIDEIRASLRLCAAAYRRARAILAPGLTELDVYLAMHEAMVQEAGTPVDLKGDFACGQRSLTAGGPPTRRRLEVGDLYPLDIFPATALYSGDTCRTFCVGEPRDEQWKAFETVRYAQRLAEQIIRPGIAARDLDRAVREYLDPTFFHHTGHGIGHHGHEAPRLTPGSDDLIELGDVFTLEPGTYQAALGGGLRLENNYVLGPHGLENLFDFPMEL
ncbi:MAG: M24 family metallopeptidase [Bryobacteraceae bacterium]|nr:M24 family metallopeptidase [Bryobacteraceae bacterium]